MRSERKRILTGDQAKNAALPKYRTDLPGQPSLERDAIRRLPVAITHPPTVCSLVTGQNASK